MLKKIVIAFLLFSFSCAHAESQENALQKLVNNETNKLHISGLSLSILSSAEKEPVTYTAGVKSVENHQLPDSNALFQVGSITKTFTAFLVERAIEKNQLSLNDKVGRFFPQYTKWKNITIEQLLNHTSGMYDYIKSPNWWKNLANDHDKVWRSEALVDIAYSHAEDFTAGTAWRYSNTNYVLLGMILEKISGKPLTTLMEKVIHEAKLNHTYYLVAPYPKNIMQQMVHGYYTDPHGVYDVTATHGSWIQAGGAMVSTTRDIARWSHFFYHKQIKFQLRNTESGQDVHSMNEIGYSFAAFRMNTPEGVIWFTPGLMPGYTSMMAYAPCLDAYFTYSASSAPLKGFHKEMILGVLHELNKNKILLQKNMKLPDYCKTTKPANEFVFPKFD